MLQQTRVDTVIPYYERFLNAFPRVERLAEAPLEDVLSLWSGLGYYRRARMLHAAARAVCELHGGVFPRSAVELRTLPGVGRYTAGAVASIACGERAAIVDGNVARVVARLFALHSDPTRGAGLARVWSIAEALVPANDPGTFNEALMELGATVCTPRAPHCGTCPVAAPCQARARGLTDELPRIQSKKAPVPVHLAALVVQRRDRVLLAHRRAESGLFAGLWEFPSVALRGSGKTADLPERFAELVGAIPRDLVACGELVHVLSHRRLTVQVVRASLEGKIVPAAGLDGGVYDDVRFCALSRLGTLPKAALTDRVLALAEAQAREASGPRRAGRLTPQRALVRSRSES